MALEQLNEWWKCVGAVEAEGGGQDVSCSSAIPHEHGRDPRDRHALSSAPAHVKYAEMSLNGVVS